MENLGLGNGNKIEMLRTFIPVKTENNISFVTRESSECGSWFGNKCECRAGNRAQKISRSGSGHFGEPPRPVLLTKKCNKRNWILALSNELMPD